MKPLMKNQHEPTAPVDEAAYSGSVVVPASRIPAPALNRISSAPLACRTFGTLLNFLKTVRLDNNDLRGKGWDTVPNFIFAHVRGCPGLQRTLFRTVGRPPHSVAKGIGCGRNLEASGKVRKATQDLGSSFHSFSLRPSGLCGVLRVFCAFGAFSRRSPHGFWKPKPSKPKAKTRQNTVKGFHRCRPSTQEENSHQKSVLSVFIREIRGHSRFQVFTPFAVYLSRVAKCR
jgi:hypothetical protein